LSVGFYDQSCPQMGSVVRAHVQSLAITDPTSPPAFLRLLFHDCQVQGCDASILLDSDGGRIRSPEMDSSRNFAVRNRGAIETIKTELENLCPRRVSCSDIIVLAAREAVAITGGPRISVPLGRRDSTAVPSSGLADASLPPADSGVDAMLRIFDRKDMTREESVAILGAHTLGRTHCFNLRNRLYNFTDDPSNSPFELILRANCPPYAAASSTITVQNDVTSSFFDSQYYLDSISGRGVLKIDAEMAVDPRTQPIVERFARDQDEFFRAFSSAFVKLSYSGVLTGDNGAIRRRCNSLD
ncbi:hypothetical protein M569_14928, partial [Genlisea aurea]